METGYTVRKEQFKFKFGDRSQLYGVTISMVYSMKICVIGCDDNLNSKQFYQILRGI